MARDLRFSRRMRGHDLAYDSKRVVRVTGSARGFEDCLLDPDRQDSLADTAASDDDDAATMFDWRHGPLRNGFVRRRCVVRRTARCTPDSAASTAPLSDASRLSNTTLGSPRKTTLIRHD